MKGLKIDVDFRTGRRACDVFQPQRDGAHIRDPAFVVHVQEPEQGVEIRVTVDDTAVDKYRGIAGVVVLEDEAEIDAAVDLIHDEQPTIAHEAILTEYIRQKGLDITSVGNKTGRELAAAIRQLDPDAPGIKVRRKPERASAVQDRLTARG